jgi:hypothetical protein
MAAHPDQDSSEAEMATLKEADKVLFKPRASLNDPMAER